MPPLRQIITIAGKDLQAEWRTREALNASLSFAVVIPLLFSLAFDPTSDQTRQIAGGLLWMAFAFSGVLILNRSFARELPNDCLDALLVSPLPGAALFIGKCLANALMLAAVELVCFLAFGVFLNVRWPGRAGLLAAVLALGGWAIVVVGTATSALTVKLRLRELMLPALAYPLLVPALLAATQATAALFGDQTGGQLRQWLALLAGFDIIFTALALALADSVLGG